ncbi:GPW/gp25 family protein [Aestuariirhabdus haliotis]|uniref:GPW/gp25 family protein n=1 Tax=Aestuariirhabdus haliotis TaxID=2918751 RepID=UPI0020C0D271|nr:GPW/gp25 family protein [Aestuariirhabdus haliotis]MCL6419424.1 GPW/gp25 family protein [Aestuariirhabdus haliotis]
MNGMNRMTGAVASGIDHLRQSIIDILTTPIGSRVMRRGYGSRLYQIVDAPVNRSLMVEIYSAVAEALVKWEPRLELTRVQVEEVHPGGLMVSLEGIYLPDNKRIAIEGVVL